MSYDNWTREYHLTPKGWIKGTYKYYGKADEDIPRPADAIETWEEHCEQTSGWSPEDYSHKRIWRNPAFPKSKKDALLKRFPPPFAARQG